MQTARVLASRRTIILVVLGAAALGVVAALAIRPRQPVEPSRTVGWRELGSWSGATSMQTDSFLSDTGLLRLRWKARALETSRATSFRVTLHSAVSSRTIAVLVDTTDAGEGMAPLAEGLNISYFSVDSANLHWQIAADEGLPGVEAGVRND